jgi:membrane protease YdiL (CAAX protease family)
MHEELAEDVIVAELAPMRPWGPWATLGWGLLVAAAFIGVQTGIFIAFVVVEGVRDSAQDMESVVKNLEYNGLLLAIATLLSTPAALAICALVVSVRRYPLLEYLAVQPFGRRDLAIGLGCLAVFIPASDGLTYLSGRPIVHESMLAAWQTAGLLPLLILAVVVAAPLGEELFFRGFLFRGWSESRLGPVGATLLISVIWAAIHLQYDWFHMSHIVAVGVLFGWLRYRSGSVLLPMLLHALMNLVATIQTAVKAEWIS